MLFIVLSFLCFFILRCYYVFMFIPVVHSIIPVISLYYIVLLFIRVFSLQNIVFLHSFFRFSFPLYYCLFLFCMVLLRFHVFPGLFLFIPVLYVFLDLFICSSCNLDMVVFWMSSHFLLCSDLFILVLYSDITSS